VVLGNDFLTIGANQFTGLRFLPDIPPGDEGVVITSARIQFTASDNTSVTGAKVIQIEDSDDAAGFSAGILDKISLRDTTGGSVNWIDHNNLNNIPDWFPNEAGTIQATPDLTSLVQEIIDKPGWAPKNGMVFIISGTGEQHAISHNKSPSHLGSPSQAPKLIIAYTISTLSVSERPISDSADDAEEEVGGLMDGDVVLDSDTLKLGANQLVGLRFLADIPPSNATLTTVITSAKIQFTSNNDTIADGSSKLIEIEDSDNALTFSAAENISSRIPTGNSVTWDNIPDWNDGDTSSAQLTPDLTSLVQEIIDKPGWVSGNGMVFRISGTGDHHAFSSDIPDKKAPRIPKLIITYTTVVVFTGPAPPTTHQFVIPSHTYSTVGPFDGAFNVTANVFDGDDVGVNVSPILVHVRYATDNKSDYESPFPKKNVLQGSTIPVKFVVTNVFGVEVQTPHSYPIITTDDGSGKIPGFCFDKRTNTTSPFAKWGGSNYHCNLLTATLEPGTYTIAINLDDGIDPSTISDDREFTVKIKEDTGPEP